MENKDIRITLSYSLEEVNHLLTLLGALPLPIAEEKQDAEEQGNS
jgi:hypothetical protein